MINRCHSLAYYLFDRSSHLFPLMTISLETDYNALEYEDSPSFPFSLSSFDLTRRPTPSCSCTTHPHAWNYIMKSSPPTFYHQCYQIRLDEPLSLSPPDTWIWCSLIYESLLLLRAFSYRSVIYESRIPARVCSLV